MRRRTERPRSSKKLNLSDPLLGSISSLGTVAFGGSNAAIAQQFFSQSTALLAMQLGGAD